MSKQSTPCNINGWLILDKPKGIGSTDIVNLVKKKIGKQKVGHGGTLDPQATGLLPIAIGEATKTIRFTESLLKTYEFNVIIGVSTDTDDASGNIILRSKRRPSTNEIRKAVKNFKGDIEQLPPKLSALKVNGKRAYDLFRKGIKFELSPRKIFIKEIHIIERKDSDNINLKMTCGKGCYVRSLARDLGNELGCFAHADKIRRTTYGPFKLENSISLSKLSNFNQNEVKNNLIPINILLKIHPNFECELESISKILNGNPTEMKALKSRNYEIAWTHYKNVPLAIGKVENHIFYPYRVLNIIQNSDL